MHQLTRIHKFCNPHLEDSVHHIPGWHLEEETLVENWIVVTGIYIWNVLELNNFSKDTWMCLRLDTPAAHFSHQGTNKWKGTFCKSFQSKGIILDRFLVHIFRIMGLCNSFGMRATVSRFQICTHVFIISRDVLYAEDTDGQTFAGFVISSQRDTNIQSQWVAGCFYKKVATNTRQYTL